MTSALTIAAACLRIPPARINGSGILSIKPGYLGGQLPFESRLADPKVLKTSLCLCTIVFVCGDIQFAKSVSLDSESGVLQRCHAAGEGAS